MFLCGGKNDFEFYVFFFSVSLQIFGNLEIESLFVIII